MADLYRKSTLEKLSSPEQLDKALTVTSPLSWIALVAITAMIIVTIIWSIIGTIPITISATGIVSSPVSTNALYTSESGKVDSIRVHPNSEIFFGTPILTYRTGNGESRIIDSDQVGVITEIMVKPGDEITQGSEIVRFSPIVTGNQVIVCYVQLSDAKKLERGMEANIFLTSANSQTYGHMRARIINIDSFVSTATGMSYVLGKDNNLAATFQEDGAAVVAVTLELYPDPSGDTVSGYWWSNVRGSKLEVKNGSLVQAKIVVEEVAPITKLFSELKELWGN